MKENDGTVKKEIVKGKSMFRLAWARLTTNKKGSGNASFFVNSYCEKFNERPGRDFLKKELTKPFLFAIIFYRKRGKNNGWHEKSYNYRLFCMGFKL